DYYCEAPDDNLYSVLF
nr:immunoglobulin light chain junction region [Macaca mulatta]MOW06124.1 immunoglobulin light chain junction region [Macaca mulatta]